MIKRDKLLEAGVSRVLRSLSEHAGRGMPAAGAPEGDKPLGGRLAGYRSCHAMDHKYRVVYEALHERRVILVHAIGPRGSVYAELIRLMGSHGGAQ